MKLRYSFKTGLFAATVYQFAVALLLLWLTRFFFVVYNADSTDCSSFAEIMRLSMHGIRYDLTAAAYFNVLFIAMRIIP